MKPAKATTKTWRWKKAQVLHKTADAVLQGDWPPGVSPDEMADAFSGICQSDPEKCHDFIEMLKAHNIRAGPNSAPK
jgi:hypothetical protein